MVEKEEDSFDNYNNMIILCKKCYDKKEYSIVICKVNRDKNSLEYQCFKCDIIEEKDILKVNLDEDLKKKVIIADAKIIKIINFVPGVKNPKKTYALFVLPKN